MQNANVKDICYLVTNRMKTFTLVLKKRETTLFFLQCQKVNVFLIHPFTKVVAFQYGFAITLTCQCLIHFSLCPKCCLIFFFFGYKFKHFWLPKYIYPKESTFSLCYYFTFFQSHSCISFLFYVLKLYFQSPISEIHLKFYVYFACSLSGTVSSCLVPNIDINRIIHSLHHLEYLLHFKFYFWIIFSEYVFILVLPD